MFYVLRVISMQDNWAVIHSRVVRDSRPVSSRFLGGTSLVPSRLGHLWANYGARRDERI